MRLFLRTALVLLLLAVIVAGCQHVLMSRGPGIAAAPKEALRIGTYNVHYVLVSRPDGRWGLDGWERRKRPLQAAFEAMDADLVAFQEMESFSGGNDDSNNLTRAWLLRNNPGYAAAAIGDWREFPSTQPIFYRTDRFDLLDQGWYFFSETPGVIYSRTFNGSYPAFASWAQFRDSVSGARFRVLNVHLDYSSAENRRKSTELMVARTEPWIRAGETVFLAGDLNAWLGSSLHDGLERIGLEFTEVTGATYHFDLGLHLFGAIDHIAYSGAARPVGLPMVLRDKFGAVWPTDHYPVVADFMMAPTRSVNRGHGGSEDAESTLSD